MRAVRRDPRGRGRSGCAAGSGGSALAGSMSRHAGRQLCRSPGIAADTQTVGRKPHSRGAWTSPVRSTDRRRIDMSDTLTRSLPGLIARAAEPLPDIDDPGFGAFFDRYGDARVILLGEAS